MAELSFTVTTPSRHPANYKAYDAKTHRYEPRYVAPTGWDLALRVLPQYLGATSYAWTVTGSDVEFRFTATQDTKQAVTELLRVRIPRPGTYRIVLRTTLPDGTVRTDARDYRLRDFLVVSIGDSFSSGQGNPDIPAVRPIDETLYCRATTIAIALPKLKAKVKAVLDKAQNSAIDRVEELPYAGKIAAAYLRGVDDVRSEIIATTVDLAGDALSLAKKGAYLVYDAGTELGEEVLGAFGIGDGGEKPKRYHAASWQESKAYRSYRSGPSRAARFVEQDTEYGADRVTFLSFARSGSQIEDGLLGPRRTAGQSIDGWIGDIGQIEEAARSLAGRRIDALVISIGINDAGFATTLENFVLKDFCRSDAAGRRAILSEGEARITERRHMPTSFATLRAEIMRRLDPLRVFLMEYPIGLFTSIDKEGNVVDAGAGGLFETFLDADLTPADAGVARRVGMALNRLLQRKADEFGWTIVDGIERDFNGHGYSAPHSYYVSAEESCMRQGDFEGMCHPNDRGLEFVRARLTCALARQLTMSDTAMVPALHLNMMS